MVILISITLVFSFCTNSELTQEQRGLVNELNDWLVPLESDPLNLKDSQLVFLNQLGGTRILGLGEATHGTREFFQMKHRIFKYMVKHFYHRAFGFEADFAGSLYLDKYVTQGIGNPYSLLYQYNDILFWRTKEVVALLVWMREYNLDKPEEEKIHFFGIDCQDTDHHPELIQEYLLRTYPDLWNTFSATVTQVENLAWEDYQNMPEDIHNAIKARLLSFKNQLIANKNLLISRSSTAEYEIAKQLLNTFRQSFMVLYLFSQGSSDDEWRDQYKLRDQFMAENALWIADFFGPATKISLWAHNGHICRDHYFIGGSSMGFHLDQVLNDLYQPVGFAFSQGRFMAVGLDLNGNYTGQLMHEIRAEPKDTSINFLFHQASHPNFVFQLDNIPAGSDWGRWLDTLRQFIRIGSAYNGNPDHYYKTLNIREQYSWLINFDFTEATKKF